MLGVSWLPEVQNNNSAVPTGVQLTQISVAVEVVSSIFGSPMGSVGNAAAVVYTLTRNSLPYDPPAVYGFAHSPNGVVTTVTPSRVLAGVYAVIWVPQTSGTWIARLSDVSTPPTSATFTVDKPVPIAPLSF